MTLLSDRTLRWKVTVDDRASRTLKGISRTVKGLGVVAGVVGTVGLARGLSRGLSSVIRIGADFEAEMSKVRAVTSATDAQFSELSKTAIELGRTTVFSARQVAEAQNAFALAGLRVDEIVGALPATLSLAAAGELGMGEAASIASSAIRAMGFEVSKLDEVVDILALTASRSNQTVRDIGVAMKFAAPAAKIAGVEFLDLAAVLGILANRGISASLAGTAFRKTIATFFGEAQDGAKGLGTVSKLIFDQTGKLKEFSEVIRILRDNGIEAAQAFDIFGARAGNMMAILLDLGPAAVDRFKEKLRDFTGFADQVAGVKLDNLRGDVVLLNSAWEGLAVTITQAATPGLRSFITTLTGMTNAMTENESAVRSFGEKIGGLARLTITGVIGMIKAWRLMKLAIQGLKLTFNSITFAVANFLTEATVAFGEFRAFIVSTFGGLKTDVLEALAFISREWRDFYQGLPKPLQAALGITGAALNKLADDTADRLAAAARSADTETQQLFEGYRELAQRQADLWRGMAEGAVDNAETILAETEVMESEITGLINRLETLRDAFKNVGDESSSIVDQLANATEETKRQAVALEAVGRSAKEIQEAFNQLDTALASGGFIAQRQIGEALRILEDIDRITQDSPDRAFIFVSIGKQLDDLIERFRRMGRQVPEFVQRMRTDVDRAFSDLTLSPDIDVSLDALNRRLRDIELPEIRGVGTVTRDIEEVLKLWRDLDLALAEQPDDESFAFISKQIEALREKLNAFLRELPESARARISLPVDLEPGPLDVGPLRATLDDLSIPVTVTPEIEGIDKLRTAFAQLDVTRLGADEAFLLDRRLEDAASTLLESVAPGVGEVIRRTRELEREGTVVADSFRSVETALDALSASESFEVFADRIEDLKRRLTEMRDIDIFEAWRLLGEIGLEELRQRLEDGSVLVRGLGDSIRSAVRQTAVASFDRLGASIVGVFDDGSDSLKKWLKNFLRAMASAIAQALVLKAIMATIPGFGNLLGFSKGGTVTAGGGGAPVSVGGGSAFGAQRGLLVPGVDRGVDEVLGLLRPREAVLPPELSDYLIATARATRNRASRDASDRVTSRPSDPTTATPTTVNLTVQALDASGFRELLEERHEELGHAIQLAVARRTVELGGR